VSSNVPFSSILIKLRELRDTFTVYENLYTECELEFVFKICATPLLWCPFCALYNNIQFNLFGVVPVSLIGYVVGIAGLGAVAVTVRVRSQVKAIS
jgi:hypothetical protein